MMTAFNGAAFHVGDPENDVFTRSVFDNRLAKAHKFVVKPADPTDVRTQLMRLIANASTDDNSLDIIADAPGGIQRIGKSTVSTIMEDARSTLDDELVGLIRSRFKQCRLLGCVTALDPDVRKHMLALADLLKIPVVGTLRAIAFPDFDDTSFRDIRLIDGEEMTLVLSTDQITPSGSHVDPAREEVIASGIIQREWLRGYDQAKVGPEDLEGEAPGDAPRWPMPHELLDSDVAATDEIFTSAAGVVALQVPSGAVRVRCEVLARATLLRLKSKNHGWVYVNVPPRSAARQDLLGMIPA